MKKSKNEIIKKDKQVEEFPMNIRCPYCLNAFGINPTKNDIFKCTYCGLIVGVNSNILEKRKKIKNSVGSLYAYNIKFSFNDDIIILSKEKNNEVIKKRVLLFIKLHSNIRKELIDCQFEISLIENDNWKEKIKYFDKNEVFEFSPFRNRLEK